MLKDLISEKLPRFAAHLASYSVDISLVTFNWFLCIFVDSLPVDLFLQVWDAFLFEGSKVCVDSHLIMKTVCLIYRSAGIRNIFHLGVLYCIKYLYTLKRFALWLCLERSWFKNSEIFLFPSVLPV